MQLRSRALKTLTVAGTLVAAVALHAQADRARALQEQIDRIFKAREYDAPRFGPARWLPDGTAYAIVERPAGGAEGSDIVRYDAATGARTRARAGVAARAARRARRRSTSTTTPGRPTASAC